MRSVGTGRHTAGIYRGVRGAHEALDAATGTAPSFPHARFPDGRLLRMVGPAPMR